MTLWCLLLGTTCPKHSLGKLNISLGLIGISEVKTVSASRNFVFAFLGIEEDTGRCRNAKVALSLSLTFEQ